MRRELGPRRAPLFQRNWYRGQWVTARARWETSAPGTCLYVCKTLGIAEYDVARFGWRRNSQAESVLFV